MNAVLNKIYQILESDRGLRRQVSYTVSTRAQGRRNNLAHFTGYRGPEDETVAVLAENCEQWFQNPALFWQTQAMPDFDQLISGAQIVGLFLARDLSDK